MEHVPRRFERALNVIEGKLLFLSYLGSIWERLKLGAQNTF